MNIPKYTGDIFDILSKGQFICSNSSDEHIRKLYNTIEEHQDALYDYFHAIGLILESGAEFYYFSRKEVRADLERKLETAFKWIDVLDFFKTYDNSFGPGYRFTPSDILVRVNVDAVLKAKLEGLKKHTAQENYTDSVRRLLDMLVRDHFIELEAEILANYKVLTSFKYLEDLVLSINIPDEVQNEIPE